MSGELNYKIGLLAPSRLDDAGGGASIVWTPGPEVWAQVERLSSTRDFVGDRTNRLKRIAVTLRNRTDITLGHQLSFDNDHYEIVSLEDGDDKNRMTLVCEEVRA